MAQLAAVVPVTALISRRVRPGREREFEDWQRGIDAEAARFAGYLGITVLKPSDAERPEYVAILQFDHPDRLRAWMDSDARRDWLKRAEPLVEAPDAVRELTGLEHWFTLPGRPLSRAAPRHKMWLLSWLAGFGLIWLLTSLLGGPLARYPRALNLLVLSFLMTGLMTYLVMPAVTRLLWRWLYPPR
jgi:hypothetical protein